MITTHVIVINLCFKSQFNCSVDSGRVSIDQTTRQREYQSYICLSCVLNWKYNLYDANEIYASPSFLQVYESCPITVPFYLLMSYINNL